MTDDTTTPEPADAPTPEPAGDTAEKETGKGGKDAVLADLAKERDRRQALEAQLQEYQDAQKTDAEKTAERLTAAETAAAESSAELARYKAAAEADLPLNMAGRLRGDSLDDLIEDAKALKEHLAPPNRFTGSADGGVRKPTPAKVNRNDLLRAAINGA